MKELCKETSSFKDIHGDERYFTCEKPIKYKVEYNDGARGERKIKNVCGIHCNSIKKWDKRMREKTSFKPNLIITEIKTP